MSLKNHNTTDDLSEATLGDAEVPMNSTTKAPEESLINFDEAAHSTALDTTTTGPGGRSASHSSRGKSSASSASSVHQQYHETIMLPKHIFSWTIDDVSHWLALNNFTEYIELLCSRHRIDGRVLVHLTEEELRREPLSMVIFGDVKRLCLAIGAAREYYELSAGTGQLFLGLGTDRRSLMHQTFTKHSAVSEPAAKVSTRFESQQFRCGKAAPSFSKFAKSQSFPGLVQSDLMLYEDDDVIQENDDLDLLQEEELVEEKQANQAILSDTFHKYSDQGSSPESTPPGYYRTAHHDEAANSFSSSSGSSVSKSSSSSADSCDSPPCPGRRGVEYATRVVEPKGLKNNPSKVTYYSKPYQQQSSSFQNRLQVPINRPLIKSHSSHETSVHKGRSHTHRHRHYHHRKTAEFKPEAWKAIVAMLYFFASTWVTAIVMVIVHDRVPDMDTYPPLPDILLDNLPLIPWAFGMCEFCGLVLFIIWATTLIFHKHRFILLRRMFSLFGSVFLLRCVTMLITSLSVPGRHLECKARPYGSWTERLHQAYLIWQGGGMSIQGVRTCGDYMFSGHTVVLTLMNFFITEYTPTKYYLVHTLSWVLNLFGIFFILAAHEHYSIDVFIAFYISTRLFLYYHTLANNRALYQRDRHRTRIWFPLFYFFESSVNGIVPNTYEVPFRRLKNRLVAYLSAMFSAGMVTLLGGGGGVEKRSSKNTAEVLASNGRGLGLPKVKTQ